ncbi:AfsR/SARP family transcriptional regulator [Lentzea jiangxiensis]|uniref:DNA-binding transcriptional activator of the SARP family n=1 Tax=Lentzea jiangxiensis TaxID=641025 RepID=A0A1H0X5G0_9PSEU|nr:BTAD domain-containing putative transcriptional regulator [Lentzea jiangxiensis]SDP98173.1 DNA-binding transcriptional activator of the SARP family [Lentzea jiangxiensis]
MRSKRAVGVAVAVVVRLLGEVGVEIDRRSVDLGTPRQRCVLAALAVDTGQVVPVDRLVERVWGVDAAPRARATLHNYISRLRRALASANGLAIVRRAGGYALVADTVESVVDLHRFRDLRATAAAEADDERTARLLTDALLLWRGHALTGVDCAWAEVERDRLALERLAVQHDLTDARLRLGGGSGLVAELTARAAEHPLDERIAGQCLVALHQAGRTGDALEHYRRLRERLVDELGIDPGDALQDLHRRILTSDPVLPTATAGRSSFAPAQLPTEPKSFTGRVAQLAALDRALPTPDGSPSRDDGRGQKTTVVISGAGGIGKTWLALIWAHRNLHHFPDGHLSVDLRGFDVGEPRQALDVLADFLAALGVDRDHQPQDLDARAAFFRTRTAGKRMLVLLDNAVTADQVVPLLPGGTGCTVLITSRNRLSALLTRHGAEPVQVGLLSAAEARTVIDAALDDVHGGTAAAQVTELVAQCGGFPLVVGLVAARIRTDAHLLDDIVTELRELGLDALDSDDPSTSLPTVLSWSLRHLTDRERAAFALLGIAPGPDIDLPAAASLTGLPVCDTRALLHRLADASLVIPASGGRYLMHDLIRAYAVLTARNDLPEPTRRAALQRAVDFYLHTAYTADRILNPRRAPIALDQPSSDAHSQALSDASAALAWLDTHHPHLIAAQHTATAQDRPQAVWHLAWTLSTHHLRRGHRHVELAMWQAAAHVIEHLPDPNTRERIHRRLGLAHSELGQHRQAIDHLSQALALAEDDPDPIQQAYSHEALSQAWARSGDDGRAMEHARRAMELYRALDEPLHEADTLNRVGWYASLLGDYDTGRDHCRAALALHRHHANREGEADALDSLGWIDHHTGHHRQAIHQYERALTLFRALGNSVQVASTLEHLGHPHTALGQHEQAATAWREALELLREQGRHDDAERVQRRLFERLVNQH